MEELLAGAPVGEAMLRLGRWASWAAGKREPISETFRWSLSSKGPSYTLDGDRLVEATAFWGLLIHIFYSLTFLYAFGFLEIQEEEYTNGKEEVLQFPFFKKKKKKNCCLMLLL